MDGRRHLDFTSGIGVTNTGHRHPKVVAAVQEQAARLLHGQSASSSTAPSRSWQRSCSPSSPAPRTRSSLRPAARRPWGAVW
ncbi:MAG: aminotransferase class III-fold pyridoxal phosphate-dependent enzyme [Thermoflexus sp.]|nr:aminotransferase class III-fold pyridoxal phosphate-dependent enzyme [Thermoflexus sp.]